MYLIVLFFQRKIVRFRMRYALHHTLSDNIALLLPIAVTYLSTPCNYCTDII